jgi:YggT family protein
MFGTNSAIGSAIVILLQIIEYAILLRVILSWLPIPKDNQLIRILYQITDPVLLPIRNMIEKTNWGKNMMIDFSPLIAFAIIMLLVRVVSSVFRVPVYF